MTNFIDFIKAAFEEYGDEDYPELKCMLQLSEDHGSFTHDQCDYILLSDAYYHDDGCYWAMAIAPCLSSCGIAINHIPIYEVMWKAQNEEPLPPIVKITNGNEICDWDSPCHISYAGRSMDWGGPRVFKKI